MINRILHCLLACGLLAAGCGSKTAAIAPATKIGSAGGTVTAPGGLRLDIPAGALASDTQIRVTTSADGAPTAAGPITALYRFEPSGLVFRSPVQVTIPLPAGISAASVYWSLAGRPGWRALETHLASGAVTALTTHFSTAFLGAPVGAPGVVWQGAWNGSTAYQVNDAVQYQGSSYIAIAASSGSAPPAAAWDVLAAKGNAGAQGVAGPQGATGGAGPEGPQGPAGTATGGLVWKDATGNVVPGVVDYHDNVTYFDAGGNMWFLDAATGMVSTQLGIYPSADSGTYATTDCTGTAYTYATNAKPRVVWGTLSFSTGTVSGPYHAGPDDPTTISGYAVVTPQSARNGTFCSLIGGGTPTRMVPVDSLFALPALTVPTLNVVAPLHPELVR
jgi:hypothetical protein